ncbi:MAG: DUF1611 domain-containing protein [Brevundimonas sp.]|nr:DUF1611 domain-containing protein [Brevundimonas sp.]
MTSEVRHGGRSGRTAELRRPYLLFLGDIAEPAYTKTAMGLRDWAREDCLGEYVLPGGASVGLTRMTSREARASGARSLVIAVATPGGAIPPVWIPTLVEALEAGLDLVSGMHAKLADIPELAAAADRCGRSLLDVRTPPADIPVGTGRKRTGRRLLTVGTDCALGKKYAALAIARALSARGVKADFRATGQTGILIAGGGMPMDAVVADFAAGAAEMVSPDNDADHWDVIEGQGSLSHPAYAGVALSLLHGSQPDVIVVCHDPTRTRVLGHPDFPMPCLDETIDLALRLGARTNPAIRCAGVALNTSVLTEPDARRVIAETSALVRAPAADPMRSGAEFEDLLDAIVG